MIYEVTERPEAADSGCVAHLSQGGWGYYHRRDCTFAPHRGEPGVRHVVHGPWRYLSAHWQPCPVCTPPVVELSAAA